MKTKRYPVDLSTIIKGRVFSPEEIEYLTGAKRGTPEYALALLNLRTHIENALITTGHPPLTLKCDHNSLRVLTDAEAAEYNAQQFDRLQRRAARRFALQMAVDISELSENERETHEKKVLVNGKILQAISNVRKQFKLKPHERKTPSLKD